MNKKNIDPSTLAYRPCVGIMVINAEGLVWAGQRAEAPGDSEGAGAWWQMPQGGIDKGEEPAAAALRELEEETNITSATIIAETPGWLSYDLPPDLVGKAWRGKYRGQKQKWFAARFTGPDSEINITPDEDHKIEFAAWRWVPASELVDLVVPFKQDVYRQVLQEFAPLVKPAATG